MIKALIFDLDGTLVQTEILKAKSYARAVMELCPESISESEVIEAFKEVVGLSRNEVARRLMSRFQLEKAAGARMFELNVQTPWQAFLQLRLGIYESMIENPHTLIEHRCPNSVSLLKWARQQGYLTGLATMSHRPQAMRVLKTLNLQSEFHFIATRDDVENGKPEPEIYSLMARQLKVHPHHCLVIEDSPSGVCAALAAGMGCIAVATDFTRKILHDSNLLESRWVVESTPQLVEVAKKFVIESNTNTKSP